MTYTGYVHELMVQNVHQCPTSSWVAFEYITEKLGVIFLPAV